MPQADVGGRELLDNVRQDHRACPQRVVFDSWNVQRNWISGLIAAHQVLGGDLQPVAARLQVQRLLINSDAVDHLRQHLSGLVHLHGFLEPRGGTPRDGSDAAVEVHDRGRNVVLLLELKIFHRELDGDIGQHGRAGQRNVIHPDLHRQQVVLDAGIDRRFQVLILGHRWTGQLGERLQAAELAHAFGQRHGSVPRCVPSVRVKRQGLQDMPICSIMVKPAPGTYRSASFSDGSMVM